MDFPVTFEPYVGSQFHQQAFKILVLGESHYFGTEDWQTFNSGNLPALAGVTQKVVHEFLAYKRGQGAGAAWMRTFTKFSNLLKGEKLSNADLGALWETLAFYNFVQTPMGGPRQAPTAADFTQSEAAFKTVLKQLSPNLIIFWGHRLWNHFPKDAYHNNNGIHTLSYDRDYALFVVPHPSSLTKNAQAAYQELRLYMERV